jgi:cytochrome b subunit of formate dehydrogenase
MVASFAAHAALLMPKIAAINSALVRLLYILKLLWVVFEIHCIVEQYVRRVS